MNQNYAYFCRMENFCYHNLQNYHDGINKGKSLKVTSEDVYWETFNDIFSLLERVHQLSKIWVENKQKNENNCELLEYPGFLIYNKWKDWGIVSYCLDRWYFAASNFSIYVKKYIISLHSDKYAEYLYKLQGKTFDVTISIDNSGCEIDLLSKELFEVELKHFFGIEPITEQTQQNIFYPEMVRRGYVDILNN